jgi:superfamily II DNA or RNA helicase
MNISNSDQTKIKTKNLYNYQENDINNLFTKLEDNKGKCRLLYQLPTGGGKTVIFSEIAARFISTFRKKVIVLTHRIELCNQTSAALKMRGTPNLVISSKIKKIAKNDKFQCYVAMVETLKNRINDGVFKADDIGLVIVDEAHHNSFQKLLGKFKHAAIIGVTATPFSSDINLPMNKNYEQLIIGEQIGSLINQGFLAKPTSWRYDIELNTLKTGIHGDYTVSTSDELYSSKPMLDLLVHAYQEHSKNKKTLIFNNGIFTSRKVEETFLELGYPIKHLDNKTCPLERGEILKWFKKTKGAILTSVSILTTGFDEPTIQTVILNRATTSLTLYHQMIGRGSRRLPQKKTFTIIDLGNNIDRFGEWHVPIDWNSVFEHPEIYHEGLNSKTNYEAHLLPSEMRSKFPNSIELSFDIQAAHHKALESGQKAKIVIRDSIRQHALMCIENSNSTTQALELTQELEKEIDWRIKQYGKCLGRVTKNYTDWLKDDYMNKLKKLIQKIRGRRELMQEAV